MLDFSSTATDALLPGALPAPSRADRRQAGNLIESFKSLIDALQPDTPADSAATATGIDLPFTGTEVAVPIIPAGDPRSAFESGRPTDAVAAFLNAVAKASAPCAAAPNEAIGPNGPIAIEIDPRVAASGESSVADEARPVPEDTTDPTALETQPQDAAAPVQAGVDGAPLFNPTQAPATGRTSEQEPPVTPREEPSAPRRPMEVAAALAARVPVVRRAPSAQTETHVIDIAIAEAAAGASKGSTETGEATPMAREDEQRSTAPSRSDAASLLRFMASRADRRSPEGRATESNQTASLAPRADGPDPGTRDLPIPAPSSGSGSIAFSARDMTMPRSGEPVQVPSPAAPLPMTVSLTPAPAVVLAPPVGALPGETSTQVVQAIRLQWRSGVGEARIQLEPEHFGELTVFLRVDRGQVVARLQAEMPVVREWLQANEGWLRQSLSDQHLTLQRLEIAEPPAETQDAPRDSTEEQRRQQEQFRRPKRRETGDTFDVVL